MKKQLLAIYDLELDYAVNFAELMSRKRNIPFEVHAFTELKELQQFVETRQVAVLLVSERAVTEEMRSWKVGQLLILAEGEAKEAARGYPIISKFQSSDAVIREVMACYGSKHPEITPMPVARAKAKLIGVYSPVGRCQKTSFALTLGQILAKNRAVLYLNLEEYAGFEQLFQTTYEQTLSDLLYQLSEGEGKVLQSLNNMVCSLQNLDFVPPVLFPQDIAGVTGEEWEQLLEMLQNYSNYQVIILDLGDGVQEIHSVLDRCDKIYMPVRQDAVSRAKIQQFEQVLRMWNCAGVLEKTSRLKIPYHRMDISGEHYLEQLAWSELGDYARERIRKDQL